MANPCKSSWNLFICVTLLCLECFFWKLKYNSVFSRKSFSAFTMILCEFLVFIYFHPNVKKLYCSRGLIFAADLDSVFG